MSADGNATTVPPQQAPAANTTAADRRQQVMLGDLPDDFLRSGRTQEQEDERIARILQAQQQAGLYQPVPSNVAGRLSITLVQAKLNKNYGLIKMDPYCRVRLGHIVFETAHGCQWGYLPHGVDCVRLEIFDERSFTTDDRVAWAVITIPESVMNGETADEWFSLSGRLGDGHEGSVNVVLSLTPLSSIGQPGYMTAYGPPLMMPMYYPQSGGQVPAQSEGGPVLPEQQPEMTEEDLQQVKDMFPNMEDQVIKSVFEANNGNKDATINSLLSINSE